MHPLDNPLWAALTSSHAGLAVGHDRARRYPADVGPFLAIADPAAETRSLFAPGEVVSLIGVAPQDRSGWEVEYDGSLLQMVAAGPGPAGTPDPTLVALGESDVEAMLDLTAIAFPGYFRPRTIALGRYFGLHAEGRLVAMAGERMQTPTHREISGVCTHPDHVGRGHARRLMQHLQALHTAEGVTSFLHVSTDNAGAIRLYESLGFAIRAELPLVKLRASGRGSFGCCRRDSFGSRPGCGDPPPAT